MQSSQGKKLHRTPPLPSMEEIKCQLHHPRKEAEPVPDEPCRNQLVISRDASKRHFRVLPAHESSAENNCSLSHDIFYIVPFREIGGCFFSSTSFFFSPSPLV